MIINKQSILAANAAAHDEFAARHDVACSYIAREYPREFYRGLLMDICALCGRSPAGAVVTELGCGTAHNVPFLFAQGIKSYTGLDISPGMIERAKSKHADQPQAAFLVADVDAYLAEHPESADLILSSSFVHHVHDLATFLGNVATALRPGGTYIALHEPYRHKNGGGVRALGFELDSELNLLVGLDDKYRTLAYRCRRFFWAVARLGYRMLKRLTGAISPGVNPLPAVNPLPGAGHREPAADDLVDFQLNFEFTPIRVFRAAPSGLQMDFCLYSYYVHRSFAAIFGESNNYFAVWFHKPITSPASAEAAADPAAGR